MSRYGQFTRLARTQDTLVAAERKASAEGGGDILLEGGKFVIAKEYFPAVDPRVKLYLGDGATLEVRDGLTPDVRLTLPDDYVEALDTPPAGRQRIRALYWSSPKAPSGLSDPTQNPDGLGDLVLYVPDVLEPAYREEGFPEWGTPSRRYLEIWEGYVPPSHPARGESLTGEGGEDVKSPDHYTWLGQSLAALGLSDAASVESWDVLDAAFPQDPLLWNCGKYLLRQGRKGGEEKRLEDLRKARQYLDRRIARLTESGVSD